jgi:hypothetical protein
MLMLVHQEYSEGTLEKVRDIDTSTTLEAVAPSK